MEVIAKSARNGMCEATIVEIHGSSRIKFIRQGPPFTPRYEIVSKPHSFYPTQVVRIDCEKCKVAEIEDLETKFVVKFPDEIRKVSAREMSLRKPTIRNEKKERKAAERSARAARRNLQDLQKNL
ncbi:hypothetical protein GCK72_025840 [Caenorhabditis remanei]|nr:hypothetical protein GCK72_025840 [Caenorhabditis remanei]KAF1749372.1 hypothetical protein GCK72_025840 [Caenorhabditis remanei]